MLVNKAFWPLMAKASTSECAWLRLVHLAEHLGQH